MIRNATEQLTSWNNSKHRKPLIVWGARQVGKTYLVKELFAEKYYKKNYVYIDCKLEKSISDYCETHINPKDIMTFISVAKNQKITENTLLIFDEVQECPAILTSLKYFCQDYPAQAVIATGSMVRIKLQRISRKRGAGNTAFLFPVGKINQITVYPMSFDEFLQNWNPSLYEMVKDGYRSRKPLPKEYHDLALDAVYRYLLIGGMPEAVGRFLESEDYLESRHVLAELYDNYLSDMELYQASPEAIVRSRRIFESVYTELNHDSKNFKSGLIESGSKTRDFKNPIDWLTTAHILHQSYQLKEHITIPLAVENESKFRLFLGDIGMFSYQSGVSPSSFITGDSGNSLSGIFYENFIANELVAKGNKLFYWCGRNDAELEFVVQSGDKLYPMDVKKTKGSLNSLKKFSEHNRYEYAVKISKNNYGWNEEQKLLTVPFYYFPFLAEELANPVQ